MVTRIIGGLGFFIVAAFPIWFGGVALDILLAAICAISFYEVIHTTFKKVNIPLFLLMATFFVGIYYLHLPSVALIQLLVIGIFILAVFQVDLKLDALGVSVIISMMVVLAMNFLRSTYELKGFNFLAIYLIVAPCVTDIGAYFTGMTLGKHKLIERISPKKTVEGAIGGLILGCVVSYGLYLVVASNTELEFGKSIMLFVSLTIPIVSQFGDLAFSMIKRHFGIKDFGNIIPGHGGMLDRLDSIVFVVSYFAAIVALVG